MSTNLPAVAKVVPTYLSTLHAHERDPFIEFDEGPHVYTVHGEGGYTSVTTWNHTHFSHFDAEATVKKILKSPKMKDPTYKYHGMTERQILDSWDANRDQASSAGTQMHYDIECYWNGMDVSNNSIEFSYFQNFVRDFERDHPGVVPYRTEWMVYFEELKLSGSIDMVFLNPDGTLRIYDWKRCKEIVHESPFRKSATTDCIRHLPDTNFWHYALQLNTYKTILEQKYGKTVTELCLVCIHPDNPRKNYEVIPVPVMEAEMRDLFSLRRQQVEAMVAAPGPPNTNTI